MATEKTSNLAEFVNFGNMLLQQAAKEDWARNYKKMGYPNKEEFSEILDKTQLDISATLEAVPGMIGTYMTDTGRAVDLPAPNENTASASLRIKDVPRSESEGVIPFGEKKGQKWTSVTEAHSEFTVRSKNKKFKNN